LQGCPKPRRFHFQQYGDFSYEIIPILKKINCLLKDRSWNLYNSTKLKFQKSDISHGSSRGLQGLIPLSKWVYLGQMIKLDRRTIFTIVGQLWIFMPKDGTCVLTAIYNKQSPPWPLTATVNQHPPAHHPLDVVDEPQLR
jgi:hypothetical protein